MNRCSLHVWSIKHLTSYGVFDTKTLTMYLKKAHKLQYLIHTTPPTNVCFYTGTISTAWGMIEIGSCFPAWAAWSWTWYKMFFHVRTDFSTTSDRSKVGGGAGFRRISPHCKFSCQSLLLMICSVLLNTVTPLKHPQRRNASCRGNSDSLTVRGLYLLSNTVSFVPVIFPSLIIFT